MNASFPSILFDEAEKNSSPDLFSKADFLHAVETLAGNSTSEFTTGDTLFSEQSSCLHDMENVFVACPFDTWKQTFGKPQDVQDHHAIQAWEQPCSDGVVHCVGNLVDDPHDGQRVVLTRVCLF